MVTDTPNPNPIERAEGETEIEYDIPPTDVGAATLGIPLDLGIEILFTEEPPPDFPEIPGVKYLTLVGSMTVIEQVGRMVANAASEAILHRDELSRDPDTGMPMTPDPEPWGH